MAGSWQWQCVDGGMVGGMVDSRMSVKHFTAFGQYRVFYMQNPVVCSKLRFYSPLTVSIAEIAIFTVLFVCAKQMPHFFGTKKDVKIVESAVQTSLRGVARIRQAALAAILGGATRADSFADGDMAGAENAWGASGGNVHGGAPPQL